MLEYLCLEDVPDSLMDIAIEIGIENFKKVIKCVGGSSVYFPSVNCIIKPVRNRVIRERFRGNYKEISKMYGISEVQIRNIINEDKFIKSK